MKSYSKIVCKCTRLQYLLSLLPLDYHCWITVNEFHENICYNQINAVLIIPNTQSNNRLNYNRSNIWLITLSRRLLSEPETPQEEPISPPALLFTLSSSGNSTPMWRLIVRGWLTAGVTIETLNCVGRGSYANTYLHWRNSELCLKTRIS